MEVNPEVSRVMMEGLSIMKNTEQDYDNIIKHFKFIQKMIDMNLLDKRETDSSSGYNLIDLLMSIRLKKEFRQKYSNVNVEIFDIFINLLQMGVKYKHTNMDPIVYMLTIYVNNQNYPRLCNDSQMSTYLAKSIPLYLNILVDITKTGHKFKHSPMSYIIRTNINYCKLVFSASMIKCIYKYQLDVASSLHNNAPMSSIKQSYLDKTPLGDIDMVANMGTERTVLDVLDVLDVLNVLNVLDVLVMCNEEALTMNKYQPIVFGQMFKELTEMGIRISPKIFEYLTIYTIKSTDILQYIITDHMYVIEMVSSNGVSFIRFVLGLTQTNDILDYSRESLDNKICVLLENTNMLEKYNWHDPINKPQYGVKIDAMLDKYNLRLKVKFRIIMREHLIDDITDIVYSFV